jgi:predicted ATPase
MIESIRFKNFKVLQDAELPLGRFTLIVGPNGSGKSTAMQAFPFVQNPSQFAFEKVVTAGLGGDSLSVNVSIRWICFGSILETESGLRNKSGQITVYGPEYHKINPGPFASIERKYINRNLNGFRVFSFDAKSIFRPVQLEPEIQLGPKGEYLAGVLDNLRDSTPERFEALNKELGRWLPEFDRILFETSGQGQRAFLLRTRDGHHSIRAADLSHGTLFALAFLTLAYIKNPPAIVCFEDPDHGIHPRLLREVRDAMYRLAYPKEYGEKREPVQVIATTHSPYLLDLYKDHPEEVVIAHKDEKGAHFERLSDKPDVTEFLKDAPLGEVWYSGILGGVPVKP